MLIDCAKRMLRTDDVFMYQCHTWAKFTGETDYTQEFHFDFGNHTLLVPGAGHWVQYEAASAVNRFVCELLAGRATHASAPLLSPCRPHP